MSLVASSSSISTLPISWDPSKPSGSAMPITVFSIGLLAPRGGRISTLNASMDSASAGSDALHFEL